MDKQEFEWKAKELVDKAEGWTVRTGRVQYDSEGGAVTW